MRFVGSNAFFHSCFFTHNINQGVGKLVQWKSHLQKIKNTSEPQKTLCSVNTNTVKNASFTSNDAQ